ncbi:hypothetical protein EUGRSUZ_H04588 [Eucalyptus grandis]|uniref:Uncharacterized protein n=2 Tax=Eucalyptus grandis TaxID=71139 RepID=A0ACC3JYN5_EUCGR|nr:hypothetical protein EUGRSUZ_H04588 [Eucalyptus grandis]
MEKFKTLEIVRASPGSAVFHLRLNRPSSRNALSLDSFAELPLALSSLDRNPDALVLILSGAGHHFYSGIDFAALDSSPPPGDCGRAGERLRRHIKYLQRAVTAIERCRKPVIAAVHGACVGGGVDVATACDVRYCMEDAFFSRLPSIVGYGNTMELALTVRRVSGSEAKELGLVSRDFGSKRELDDGVRVIAEGK